MNKLMRFTVMLVMALSLSACTSRNAILAETDETVDNWVLARQYQAQGRYELAQQYFSLALATVRTQSSLDMLQRELAAVQLQLRAMR